MRVVQFAQYGGPEVLKVAEVPTPEPAAGQLRVRIKAAAVNPADTKWRSGMFQAMSKIPLPHVVGYDIAGEVDALGEGVEGIAVGSRVLVKLNPVTKGGYAEYAVVPAGDAVPMPQELDFPTAAAIPTAGLTGVQMVEKAAGVAEGDLVLVTGAVGAVGRFALYAAKKRGARVVAAVRRSQAEEARSIGADEIVVLGEEDWSCPAFASVLDTVGGAAVGALACHVAAGGGIFTASTTPIPADDLPTKPVFVMIGEDPARLAELARSVACGDIALPVAKVLPLDQAAEAHRLVEAGGSGGKIILEP